MDPGKTPVSILQELMLQRGLVPHYQLLSEHGSQPHKPTFVVRVFADDMTGIGKGISKKVAKQEAAKNLLHRMGIDNVNEIDQIRQTNNSNNNNGSEIVIKPRDVYDEPTTSSTILHNIETSSIDINIRKKAVAVLKYYTMQLNLPSPVYEEISACGPAHLPVFTCKCSIGSYSKEASGKTKIEARDSSALMMFESLKKLNFEIPKQDQELPQDNSITDLAKTEINSNETEINCNETEINSNESEINSNETVKSENPISGNEAQDQSISNISYGSSIDHFYIIKNYMIAKNVTYDELWKDIVDYDFKTLDQVLNMLGIKYNLTFMKQDLIFIACLLINIVPAFYIIEIGTTVSQATKSVAKNALLVLRVVTK